MPWFYSTAVPNHDHKSITVS